MTLTRRDVWKLDAPWDPVTQAYALAVGVMQERPPDDPTSWEYQAAVHGVGSVFDPPPDEFLSQCQHNSSFFLPWHRWYLYWFEQIVRETLQSIDEVPGDVRDTWALPYWDYSRADSAGLPPAFREQTLWDGVRENPLFTKNRRPGINAGTRLVDPRVAVPLAGVLDLPYSSEFAAPTFGGSDFIGFHHFQEHWQNPGQLENVPHNVVHGHVGGLMNDFSTAALDPIFWLHHCNVDRWWEVRGHQPPHTDPAGPWATFAFDFHDAAGQPVQSTSGGCVDTVGQLDYEYEDVTRPPQPVRRRGPGLGLDVDAAAAPGGAQDEGAPAFDQPPEVVGHSDEAVSLTGSPASVAFGVEAPSTRFRRARPFAAADPDDADHAGRHRVILNVEDIRGTENPGTSYAVYLGTPSPEHLAGVVSFFGIENTQPDAAEPHGLGHVFDVTHVVDVLRDEGAWDPGDIQVSFEPIDAGTGVGPGAGQGLALDAEPVPPVSIGRVSISYQ